jgi:hypothetical protein
MNYPTFTTVGSTPETFCQELETEERASSTTRERFFEELNTQHESSIDFQALYNYMSDQYVLEQFIARCTTNKLGTLKTNPTELEAILNNWLHGLSTPNNLSITTTRALNYRYRYYIFSKRRYRIFSNCCFDYADFSSWLKKRSRS